MWVTFLFSSLSLVPNIMCASHFFQTLRRSTESVLRKREQKLARISILIVIIFIICHSLKNIPTLVEMFGKDPRVSCWKYDDWTPIWRVIKNVKNWHWRTDNIYHFLLIKSISRGFLQDARSVVSLMTCKTFLHTHSKLKWFQHVPVCSQILLVGHLMLSVNSSINFLVYSFGNSRKIFRFLFSLLGKRFSSGPDSTSRYNFLSQCSALTS